MLKILDQKHINLNIVEARNEERDRDLVLATKFGSLNKFQFIKFKNITGKRTIMHKFIYRI